MVSVNVYGGVEATEGGARTSDSELKQLLYDWNATHVEYPDVCVHDLFEEQVLRSPDAVAVVFKEQRLTYSELNQRANQVAHFLREQGVGPEALVGVSLERSPELVIALLGVWKSGGAYVPLDPAYPADRLSFMVGDADVRVLLTEDKCRHLFPHVEDRTVCLDSEWARIAEHSTDNLRVGTLPSNLAYVMYTSGSTGKPKGAMILHGGLVNYLWWAIKAYGVEAGGSVPVHTSVSFDLTVTSLYPALLVGGRAELLSEDVGAQNLLAALRRSKGRTLVKITPAHLDLLSQQLSPYEVNGLTKTFVIGGENLPAESLQVWRDFAPETRLINEYGPTETVVGCCVYEVRPGDPQNGPVPIGRPIDNTELYVLDADMRPVPVGVMGELYIGGAGVARGYFNRPELTKERFLPDPFSGRIGARLYKTGDLARYRSDGVLEYLGRIDNQVKVRGYRIELGEIEAVLAGHPAVQSCAVLAREDTPGDKQLIGYVVARERQSIDVAELQSSLAERLPDYMVPVHFVVLDSFPLTENGKVDRKALPAPSQQAASTTRQVVAPRNDTEKALADIWVELLNVGDVGVEDDFFELGGHSLLVLRLLARIRDVFQVDIPAEKVFEKPTVSALAVLLAGGAESSDVAQRIEPRNHRGPSPLSFAQEQLWFLDQLVPDSPAYNIVDVIDLGETYDALALKRAVNELVRRHEILRSAFVNVDGRVMQVDFVVAEAEITEVDLSSLPEEERPRAWSALVREEGRKLFDLAQVPLLRLNAVHFSSREHKVLVTIHHIIADEWSMEIIQSELKDLYEAYKLGNSPDLAPLPIQYADFASWQRQALQGELLEKQVAYWKNELAGAPTILELPTDKPRPLHQSFRGATEIFRIPKTVLDRLQSLAREEQATIFMVLEAAFAALLHRYTQQNDILVGTPISGRTHTETQQLIGCFLNSIVLRAQFSDHETFRSLLHQVRSRALGAYAHPDLPVERLVSEITPDRDLSRTPLFQVMFILHSRGGVSQVSKVSGNHELGTGTSKVDLTLCCGETDDGLEALFEYSTDLFERETILRLCHGYATLLEALVSDPERNIAQVELLSDADRRKLLFDWNETQVAYPRDVCLHRLVERQAALTPGKVAVVFDEQSLTYTELDRKSNQLAYHLRDLGVGPDVLVGLCVERSLDMVVALLGIMKAGGAYVPLDPSFPPDRLAYMVEDSEMRVLVTHRDLDAQLGARPPAICRLDRDAARIAAARSDSLPQAELTSEHLAYVLYTSGSTGKPKGVAIAHRAIVNFLLSMQREPGMHADDTLLAVTTLSFDIAGLELYLPLISGAKVVIASRADAIDPQRLIAHLSRHECTMMQATPATWRALVEVGYEGSPKLRVLCGGEAMPPDLMRALLPRCAELWNMYGPTETTVWSTMQRITSDDRPAAIGKPIANTQVYVLDAQRNLVSPGVVGELYIGGDGLARGYLNRPELTRERFIDNPFVRKGRLYRTGDLARFRPDGRLDCLGRTDHQVKLRGYRIELGEIEAVVVRHRAVRQAVVVAREDVVGDKRLVAYVVSDDASRDFVEQLRTSLVAALPEYMVPAHIVTLDALPLTPNGKVDRKALPAPSLDTTSARRFVAPRNETEQSLAAIWSEVLNVGHIGAHDDFFQLGGHSLLVLRVLARIQDVFQINLPAQRMFEKPTLAALAAVLGEAIGSGAVTQKIAPREDTGPCALSFAQEQLWFLDQLVPESPAYNIVDVIDIPGLYDAPAMTSALNALVERHEILRTAFGNVERNLVQIVSPTGQVDLSEIDLSALGDAERDREWKRIVREHGRKQFDLARPPLIRAVVVHRSASVHRLLLTCHHIVADEWSMELMHDEVRSFYDAFVQGRQPAVAPLPIQYADFAHWQREMVRGEIVERQLEFWKSELSGAAGVLEFPTDKPRPSVQTFRGATELFHLPKSVLERVHALAREARATPFMVLEAAFAALLKRYTGQDDILVGTPISGRTRAETQGLIGCFLNTIVLRNQFAEDQSFRSLVQQVRTRALSAYAHPDLPFERLVAELAPARDPSRTPLFQAMFILHGRDAMSQVFKLASDPELGTGTSKFDLTLYCAEAENGLDGLLEYSTDLFELETIRSLCKHFGILLEALVFEPDRSVDTVPLLSETDRRKLLVEWNDTAVEHAGSELCLHELLERQCKKTPDQVAVVFGDRSLTYRELDGRSNELARRLASVGVEPDVLVGVCLERSLEMVVALVGILKAGGAYVPLDPSFPSERLGYMVEDSRMRVLVTHRNLDATLPSRPSSIVRLDGDEAGMDESNAPTSSQSRVERRHLAYVLYTSGSTGKPKGVAIEHRALVNFLLSMQREPGLSAGDTMMAVTTLSFDIAALELYLPLITGAKVVIASRDDVIDPGRLMERMRQSGCTVMQATPATWRALVNAGWNGSKTLRALCGGEAMPPDLAQALLPRCGELWNMYGPTETTVWSTVHRITAADAQAPIGKPIDNTQVYVLDAQRNVVPQGVVGELYIGGQGLARGYLNRPELTRERFVSSPLTSKARLYRTGDLARWRADGILECLGRTDHQVKLRGYRIELGEIEAALVRHPAVRQAVVIAREDTTGDKRLVAYVAAENAPADLADGLRTLLRGLLPEYMVPAHFVTMGALPLTPNGKVDRKALPAPDYGNDSALAGSYVAPRNDLEISLATAWARVLGVPRIGITDNFFEMGGSSLSVLKLIVEMQNATGIEITLGAVFRFPTIAALVESLGSDAAKNASVVVPLQPRGEGTPIFCLCGINIYKEFATSLGTEQPVLGVYVAEEQALANQALKGQKLDISIGRLAEAYCNAITRVVPDGPYRLAGISFGGILAMEVASMMRRRGAEVEVVILLDTILPRGVRRNWVKWGARQALQILGGNGKETLSQKLTKLQAQVRRRFAKDATRAPDLSIDDAFVMRQRAFYEATGTWQTEDLVSDFDVVLFRASDQRNWGSHIELDDDYGWHQLVAGRLSVERVPGSHLGIIQTPYVADLGKTAQRYLQRTHS